MSLQKPELDLVASLDGGFGWLKAVDEPGWLSALEESLADYLPALPTGYVTEYNPRLGPFVQSLSDVLGTGAILLIDYGYPRHEYYHPQRLEGTMVCHYRHRRHADPFAHVGLQDITASVDFTQVAESAAASGLTVAAEIIAQAKADKVTVFKKRRRHNYRRKKGHRQQHTILKIVAIGDHKAEKKAKPAKAEAAPAEAAAPAKTEAPKKEVAAKKETAPKAEKPKAEKPAPSKAEGKEAAPKAAKPAAKASTKDAAPAKGAAKKSPKKK